jgi:SAM-dependent methyltransferase
MDDDLVRDHYETGIERDRLETPLGVVEYERTKEIVLRHLPPSPARVADIGGGAGRYAVSLAGLGYDVAHRDLVPMHVEQAIEAASAANVEIDARVGDARSVDLGDASVDAVLLLGPLYHLRTKADRIVALAEARRIVRPGGPVFVVAISRWIARLHAVLVLRAYERFPHILDLVEDVERDGWLPPLEDRDFTAYAHRPAQLRSEARAAALEVVDLVGVDGFAFALPDLADRLEDPRGREALLRSTRALERVPELLGLSPHLLLTARRPFADPIPDAPEAS